ncbi:MAG TPA: metalloregulator ArsR/SmtB family transcription factor [Limnochordales bacterium]
MLLQPAIDPVSLKAKFFRGFADPSRLCILESLRAGPRTVSSVVEQTGLSQPNVSSHLACLLDCGLVARERQGRHVLYRLSDERVARLLSLAEELLADVARGVYLCTRYTDEREHGPAPRSVRHGRHNPHWQPPPANGEEDPIRGR